jgi:bifunctional non-homologous end joining protein LigD
MEQTTLYYRDGGSDKVYHVRIQSEGDKYSVQFQYGRRGSTMQTGTKTATPVNLDAAKAIYERLVKEKMAKGYSPGEDGTPYQNTDQADQATGIQCQLLNPIGDDQIGTLLLHPEWWVQEKFNGRRLLIQKTGAEIIGINRRSLRVAVPQTLVEDAKRGATDFLIDGEAIGDQLHAFDLLTAGGEDLRRKPYLERFLGLMKLLSSWERQHIHIVQNACTGEEKQRLSEELKTKEHEGVVFKEITAPYTAGRPASGGPALKFKFYETASFVVHEHNAKRSVNLVLLDRGSAREVGNVTIPPNHPIPGIGQVVEVRYLYAFKESGVIYQPVYLGLREDIHQAECTFDQLKFKPESAQTKR